jgi:predicted enzyme related to lactoylglutathione lyase
VSGSRAVTAAVRGGNRPAATPAPARCIGAARVQTDKEEGHVAGIRHEQLLGRRPGGGHALVRRAAGRRAVLRAPGPDGRLAYVEFRIGDYQHELGLVDRRFAPEGTAATPGGVITYWHVDDVSATFERLVAMGAKEYQPITPRGDQGFVTAAVVDPFGNVLGIMYNPHYLEILESSRRV